MISSKKTRRGDKMKEEKEPRAERQMIPRERVALKVAVDILEKLAEKSTAASTAVSQIKEILHPKKDVQGGDDVYRLKEEEFAKQGARI